mmetsp:Transcript_62330/g.197417  ORF Transcript_62330/g.197417 Transcript_62330/m.197417 type:complete len:324 (-) Transcript_62330:666-1637(-)
MLTRRVAPRPAALRSRPWTLSSSVPSSSAWWSRGAPASRCSTGSAAPLRPWPRPFSTCCYCSRSPRPWACLCRARTPRRSSAWRSASSTPCPPSSSYWGGRWARIASHWVRSSSRRCAAASITSRSGASRARGAQGSSRRRTTAASPSTTGGPSWTGTGSPSCCDSSRSRAKPRSCTRSVCWRGAPRSTPRRAPRCGATGGCACSRGCSLRAGPAPPTSASPRCPSLGASTMSVVSEGSEEAMAVDSHVMSMLMGQGRDAGPVLPSSHGAEWGACGFQASDDEIDESGDDLDSGKGEEGGEEAQAKGSMVLLHQTASEVNLRV